MSLSTPSRAVLIVGLVAALAWHLVALYAPGSPGASPVMLPGGDKLVHLLLFALPAGLLRALSAKWWPIVVLALHAPISEVVQWAYIPLRSGDGWDVVADLAGVALGVAVVMLKRKPS